MSNGFPGSPEAASTSWRSRLHRGVIAKVHQLWPPREAALIDAMVIGEEAFIDRDTRVDFQRSGTYHVLVVSGMNVSILAFVVFWTLRRLRLSEVPATLLTVAFCVGYAFITEVGAPVWRATLMCAVYLVTRLLYRDRAMVNALGAAALGLLVFDPRQLFTASFQMTFVCVLIVAAIGIPILRAHLATLQASAGELGFDGLRRAAAAASGAVSRGLAVHRRAGCASSWARSGRASSFAARRRFVWRHGNCSSSPPSCRWDSRCPWRTTSIARPRLACLPT